VEEELIYGLTPGELWVWNYLLFLAKKQQSPHIILPKPGEDRRAEKIFCRRHFGRLLKSLKSKLSLTLLITLPSKSKRIEIIIPSSRIQDLHVPDTKKGALHVLDGTPMRTSMSSINTSRTSMSRITSILPDISPELMPSLAKLNLALESLVELKPPELRAAVFGLRASQASDFFYDLFRLVRCAPQGRKYSYAEKLYVMVRFLQDHGSISNPQNWMNRIAKLEADQRFQMAPARSTRPAQEVL
jgi:hypothetical protein